MTNQSAEVSSQPQPQEPLAFHDSSPSDSGSERPLRQPSVGFWRTLRWLANLWWKVFAFIVIGNYLPGAVLAFLQGGLNALGAYLTTWGLVQPLEARSPLLFWLGTVALAILAIVGLGVELDERRGVATAQLTLRQTAQEAHTTAGRAIETAERALAAIQSPQTSALLPAIPPVPQVFGPPEDSDLLPVPDPFVGRSADLAWALERLRQPGALAAVRGLGGMGKTSLAAVAVQQLQQEGRFPDGIAVVLCQGMSDPAEVLRRLLARFDPYRRTPEQTDVALLMESARGALSGKAALVTLDNIEPTLPLAQILPPLRAAGLSVLLTARQALPSTLVPPEASRALSLLNHDEALTLFAVASGREGTNALTAFTATERPAAEAIVAALGAHTLAVKLAGAYAGSEHRDLNALARELSDPTQGLALPGDDETPDAVRRTLALSLDALPPASRQMFVGLAALATPECGRQAALALGRGLGQAQPEQSLHVLLVRALVEADQRADLADLPEESDRERLRVHPLLRALADDLFHAWSPADQDAAALAIAQHYASYAEAQQTNLRALGADEGNLTGALEWAHAQSPAQDALVVSLAHGLRFFWDRRGQFRAGARYLGWAVTAAETALGPTEQAAAAENAAPPESSDDPIYQKLELNRAAYWMLAELQLAYGEFLSVSGRPEEGATVAQRSLRLFRALRDQRGEGKALLALGDAAIYRSQFADAEAYYQQSLTLLREGDAKEEEAKALGRLGQVASFRGRYAEAETYIQQSLTIARAIGERRREAANLSLLGQLAVNRSQYSAAEDYLQQALVIDQEIGQRLSEATDLGLLGQIALRRGQFAAAETFLQKSLLLDREVGQPQGEAVALARLSQLALKQGQLEAAETYVRQSLAIDREIGAQVGEGVDLSDLGEIVLRRGRPDEAQTLLEQSLALLREVGDRQSGGESLSRLGQVAVQEGRFTEAENLLDQALTVHRETDDPLWETRSLFTLGRAAEGLDDSAQAETCYRQSLTLATDLGLEPERALAQWALGRLLATLHRREEGCALLRDAALSLATLGMSEAAEAQEDVARFGCKEVG